MSSKRVLIIDDDEGIRRVVQIILKSVAKWEVLTAASGYEGIALAQSQRPDVILLDVMMPDMDGVATLKQIQSEPAIASIPVILLTAKVQNGEQREFRELPVAGLITKPFKAPELLEQIMRILKW